jgi:hypothetical protein
MEFVLYKSHSMRVDELPGARVEKGRAASRGDDAGGLKPDHELDLLNARGGVLFISVDDESADGVVMMDFGCRIRAANRCGNEFKRSFSVPGGLCGGFQPRKARLALLVKFPIDGKIAGRSAGCTPNQEASVAAYWTEAVEGTQRPLLPESSGPPRARVGNVP